MTSKWYDDYYTDKAVVISSRVRLARNLKDFPFPHQMTEEQKCDVIKLVRKAAINLAEEFEFYMLDELETHERRRLAERHVITKGLTNEYIKNTGVLVRKDEKVSIMINENDHIRIQVIIPGNKILEAYKIADEIDSVLEEELDYAFSKKYGYSPFESSSNVKSLIFIVDKSITV